jgi:hypothetical protein
MCDRCQKKKLLTIKSVMNEDLICSGCYQEEITHPRYTEARDMEVLEAWRGNHNYPGLFAGQRYPFHERSPGSKKYPKKVSALMV